MLLNSAEFTPRRGREVLAASILRTVLRIGLKPALSPRIPLRWQRWWLRQLPRSSRPEESADIQPGSVGGVDGEWVRPAVSASTAQRATILYLHGGAYCVGSPATHRAVTSHLACATKLPVFAADYRLAPERPFPAAVDDAVAACRALMASGPIIIAGDSAGGGLAVATATALRQQQASMPAALVLFSPWVDLALSATSSGARREVMLSHRWLDACARHYLAGSDPKLSLASPIYGDLRGLPPTLIQAGSDELLCDDAVRLHDALGNAGVTVRCEIVPDRWHVFQLHAGVLAAANAAIERAADFISLNVRS